MNYLRNVNLALRGTMEAGIILALGYWGYCFGRGPGMKILLSIVVPALVFSFWGLVDFHQFGYASEALRLLQELLVTVLAAIALYSVGFHTLCWMMAIISIVHHTLVYATGDKLLK